MKFCFVLFLILVCFYSFSPKIQAIENPLTVPNNHYGVHIIDENDLDKAEALVNSNGGDWGYITLVIREDDRDPVKWQRIFDRLRRQHLIPLLRLATTPDGSNWRAPSTESAASWAEFLNSLNWVVKNRYVILFNEPNHAKEWGGVVKPDDFARIISSFSQSLKAKSPDFFILPGSVDSASLDSRDTMSAVQFYKWMYAKDPTVFSYYDGLASHSYPHPDFVGLPTDTGPGSITAYRWEQQYLQKLGLKPSLPVFITETGWAHNGGNLPLRPALKPEKASTYYEQAFSQIWTDPQIVAITPFVLNYQDKPFAQFSWVKPGGQELFPQYEAVQALPKKEGLPQQLNQVEPGNNTLPPKLILNSHYKIPLTFINRGQSIFTPETTYLSLKSPLIAGGQQNYPFPYTEPEQTATLALTLATPEIIGDFPITYEVRHQNESIYKSKDEHIFVINPPSLYVQLELWYKRKSSGNDFSLLIYQNGDLIKKISPFVLQDGTGNLSNLTDVIPGQVYRFVITKPFYLPRQQWQTLNDTITQVTFKRLLPIDFYPDGQLTLKDVFFALKHPLNSLSLLWW